MPVMGSLGFSAGAMMLWRGVKDGEATGKLTELPGRQRSTVMAASSLFSSGHRAIVQDFSIVRLVGADSAGVLPSLEMKEKKGRLVRP